jgi:hypothetical protein
MLNYEVAWRATRAQAILWPQSWTRPRKMPSFHPREKNKNGGRNGGKLREKK